MSVANIKSSCLKIRVILFNNQTISIELEQFIIKKPSKDPESDKTLLKVTCQCQSVYISLTMGQGGKVFVKTKYFDNGWNLNAQPYSTMGLYSTMG